MVQRVKVFRQVEDYRSRVSLPDILFYPEYGVFCPSPRSITKAVIREQRLIDWHELLEYRLLDDAIDNGRDTKLAYPSIRLRDLHPFDRRRGIFPLSDPLRWSSHRLPALPCLPLLSCKLCSDCPCTVSYFLKLCDSILLTLNLFRHLLESPTINLLILGDVGVFAHEGLDFSHVRC